MSGKSNLPELLEPRRLFSVDLAIDAIYVPETIMYSGTDFGDGSGVTFEVNVKNLGTKLYAGTVSVEYIWSRDRTGGNGDFAADALDSLTVEAGKKTLAESGLALITGDNILDAAQKIVAEVKKVR